MPRDEKVGARKVAKSAVVVALIIGRASAKRARALRKTSPDDCRSSDATDRYCLPCSFPSPKTKSCDYRLPHFPSPLQNPHSHPRRLPPHAHPIVPKPTLVKPNIVPHRCWGGQALSPSFDIRRQCCATYLLLFLHHRHRHLHLCSLRSHSRRRVQHRRGIL
jgi:hypothetical protein